MQALDFLIPNLSKDEQDYILALSKKTLSDFVDGKSTYNIDKSTLSSNLLKDGACFVTLKLDGALRGCIGSVVPHRPLYLDVIENSISAASHDPRFTVLTKEEAKNIDVSISVLGDLFKVDYTNLDDLFSKIEPQKDGLVLQNGVYQGLFLPSVWEDLPTKELFLSNLCLKAGFPPKLWHNGIVIYKFRTMMIR